MQWNQRTRRVSETRLGMRAVRWERGVMRTRLTQMEMMAEVVVVVEEEVQVVKVVKEGGKSRSRQGSTEMAREGHAVSAKKLFAAFRAGRGI